MRQYILHVLLVALALTACSDFLDIKPYGKTIPRTREEYKALLDETLNGIDMGSTGDEQLLGSYSLSASYEECADNLETNLTEYPSGNYLTTYIGAILSGRQSVYNYLYELIRTSNIILDGWSPDTWERADSDIVGTCHAIRGVAYYQLLRQFCAPAGSEDATLGVPIVTTFNMEAKPDRSTYAQTEAQKVVIDSQAQATKRAQEGYTYAQERGFDVAEKVAQNEAVGQFTNMGVGLGTMAGVGGAVGGVVGSAVNNAMGAAAQPAQPADDMSAFKAKVEKLTFMKESGLITEEEFAAAKADLLKSIL